jgi:hypothetical protein
VFLASILALDASLAVNVIIEVPVPNVPAVSATFKTLPEGGFPVRAAEFTVKFPPVVEIRTLGQTNAANAVLVVLVMVVTFLK